MEMKSARGRQKNREPDSNLPNVSLNLVLQVVPIAEAKNLLNHINDPIQIRDELLRYLESQERGLVHRPKRLGAVSPFGKPRAISSAANRQIVDKQSASVQITTQNSIHLPGEFIPETDLWYAAFLDYLLEGVYWAVQVWIPSCHDDLPGKPDHSFLVKEEQPGVQLPKDEEALAISMVLATMLVLIGHIQRLSLTKTESAGEHYGSKNKKVTNIVASVCLTKNFFQNIPQADRKLDYQNAKLDVFERHHHGMLGALTVKASIRIIHYLASNFLHLYRLVEKCFSLSESSRQHLVEIPCPLRFHTLPEKFCGIRSVWPPPLCEALPLSVIANYQHLFDERATKWLPCLPPVDLPSPAESASGRTSQPVESTEPTISVSDQPVIDPLEKYILTLDQMGREQWEALASISEEQAQDVVRLVLAGLSVIKKPSVQGKLTDQLRDSQIKLARRLVERARLKLEKVGNNKV
ncbi:hypothetical protein D915_006281 [Fasciola hepatica]|uniref:Uncharacterized protein n=1 Tax=Fasciola hepatica TaxID=6192 RepID=A0A4E0RA93_FASHE|nr:hypothetical protein D915_006281 [Fasciola hepatica]